MNKTAEQVLSNFEQQQNQQYMNVYLKSDVLKAMEAYASQSPAGWVRASERLPKVEVWYFNDVVEYGRMNGANIVNHMPWSFNFKGIPVTHENDNCYLLPMQDRTIRLNKDEAIVIFNGKVYDWQEYRNKGRIRLCIKYKGLPETLIFLEGCWNYYRKSAPACHIKVEKKDWENIERLDETPSHTEGEAVAFAEWACQNYGYAELNKWEGEEDEEDEVYTTQELYTLFTQSKPIHSPQ